MGLRIEWAGLYDPEMDESYFISPRSGELLALPGAEHDKKARARLSLKGLRSAARVDHVHYVDGRYDELVDPLPPAGLFARVRARFMNRFVRICLAFVSLARLAGILAVMAQLLPKSKMDRTQVFQLVAWLEGGRVKDECLPRAMLRWYYLINAGYDPALVFGIWVPTHNMHAWVMLDDKPAGELSDEVMHYQPATVIRRGKAGAPEQAAPVPESGEAAS